MKFLILVFLVASLTSSAQTFEGKIVYENKYNSKLSNLKDDQLSSMVGTKQEHYIKGQFILTSTAIEITSMSLDQNFFDILKKNKTMPANW
jgi:hypothetical protein